MVVEELSQGEPAKETTVSLREELAAYAHEAWSGWMEYMFAQCQPIPPTTESGNSYWLHIKMPKALYERWTRQMTTKYADLPESEKESDRDEADKIIHRISSKVKRSLADEMLEHFEKHPEENEAFRRFINGGK